MTIRRRKQQKEYRERTKDRIKKYKAAYYLLNKKAINKRNKKWHADNTAAVKKYSAAYFKENKEWLLPLHRNYKERNKERMQRYLQSYYKENKKRLILGGILYRKNRYKLDSLFRLSVCLRSRLSCSLRSIQAKKLAHTFELLGCSFTFFKEYIEKKFRDGMSWDNYGQWHIDHIRPCASFDLHKLSEQQDCFHYTNLQPLWAEENQRKHAKWKDEK